MDILEKIRKNYESNKTIRKKISDYILNNTLDTSFLSLKQFSEKVETTEVTVLNYCKSLGYEGFNDMRKSLQEFIISNYSPSERLYAIVKDSEDASHHYDRLASSELKCIKNTYSSNSPETLKEIIKFFDTETLIFIAAHEVSSVCGIYLSMKLRNQGIQCEMLDLYDPYSSIEKILRYGNRKKILVSITMTPYSIQTITFSSLAKKENIPVIAITDSTKSPILKCAKIALFCDTKLLGISNSPTSIMAIINQLTAALDLKNKTPNNASKKQYPVSEKLNDFFKIKANLESKNIFSN